MQLLHTTGLLLLLLLNFKYAVTESSSESALLNNLLKNYNKQARPVKDISQAVDVEYQISLVDAKMVGDEVLQISIWERMWWTDPSLRWNPSDYSGLKSVRIHQDFLWLPDITLFNKARAGELTKANAVVNNDGSIVFIPQRRLFTHCSEMNYKDSKQNYNCRVRIGSWAYSASELNVSLSAAGRVDISELAVSENWKLLAAPTAKLISKKYDCCPETYQSVDLNIKLQRSLNKSQFTFTITMLAFALLTPFTFAVRRNQGFRVAMTMALLIGLTMTTGLAQVTLGQLSPSLVCFFTVNVVIMMVCLLLHLIPRYNDAAYKLFNEITSNANSSDSEESKLAHKQNSDTCNNTGRSSAAKSKLNMILDFIFVLGSLFIVVLSIIFM